MNAKSQGGYLVPVVWMVDIREAVRLDAVLLAGAKALAKRKAFTHIYDNGSDALMKAQGRRG